MAPAVIQFKSRTGRGSSSEPLPWRRTSVRIKNLTPAVWQEMQGRFVDAEYFTRDHLLYFRSLRQFSTAYKMSLISGIVRNLIDDNKILPLSMTDLAINTPENMRRYRALQKSQPTAYSGSYTTRSADELLHRQLEEERFDQKFLTGWLECLQHLSESTQHQYTLRIVDDLVRRGILFDHEDGTYSVIHE